MQPSSLLPANSYTFSSSSATYNPGQTITFSMTGAPFRGILLYVSGSLNPAARVGTFTIPANFQDNSQFCKSSGT